MPRIKTLRAKGYSRPSPRMKEFLDGEMKVEDLDDEEVSRGQLRAADGTFRGRPVDLVPRKFFDAVQAENLRRWQQRVNEELEPALVTLKELHKNSRLPADARYKAAVYLIERVAGKVPEKTEVKLEVQPWEEDIEGLLYDVPEVVVGEVIKKKKKKKKG